MSQHRSRRGFSATELLVTIAIIAVVLALLLPTEQQSEGMVLDGVPGLPQPFLVVPAPPPALKVILDEIAKNGELGSCGESIQSGIEELAESDQVKAAALFADFQRLQKLSGSEAIKALAQKMSDEL